MSNYADNDEENYLDDNDDLLKEYVLPPEIDEKRMVLQIMDSGGNIEDIIFDIEEIYNYVKKAYESCPERN
jgi:hypothetical protein